MLHLCDKCKQVMVRSSVYDADGIFKLQGGHKIHSEGELQEWWVCINDSCEDGKINRER